VLSPMQHAEIARSQAAGKFHYKPGELREVLERDETGRTIRKFYGDPAAVWGQFTFPVYVARFGPRCAAK
jgi:hypothetical protein